MVPNKAFPWLAPSERAASSSIAQADHSAPRNPKATRCATSRSIPQLLSARKPWSMRNEIRMRSASAFGEGRRSVSRMTKRVGRRGGSLRERLLGPLLGGTERRLAPRAISGAAQLVRAPRFSGIDGAIDGPVIAGQSTVLVGIGRGQSPALGSIQIRR